MTKPLEAQFYFGAVIDHDGECQRVSDEEAQFWTVYERNADGLSSAICDCTHRNDAVAATERFNALIEALEQSQREQNILIDQFAINIGKERDKRILAEKRIAELEKYAEAEASGADETADNVLYWMRRCKELDASHSQVIQARDHYKSLVSASQRAVKLHKRSVGEVMHMSGFSRDYAEGWCAGNDNAIHEVRAAGITVQGDE